MQKKVPGGLDRGRHRGAEERTHSVGVGQQYCAQTGKQNNCQVAISLSVATWTSGLPVALAPLSSGELGEVFEHIQGVFVEST
jgi:SRSO17 transposase